MNAGAIIKAARALSGMGQRELAQRLGVSQQAVSMWEAGAKVAPERWQRVREVLGVNLSAAADQAVTLQVNREGFATGCAPTEKTTNRECQITVGADEYRLWELFCLVPENRRADLLRECRKRLVLLVNSLDEVDP